jgi:hypothetical protein
VPFHQALTDFLLRKNLVSNEIFCHDAWLWANAELTKEAQQMVRIKMLSFKNDDVFIVLSHDNTLAKNFDQSSVISLNVG